MSDVGMDVGLRLVWVETRRPSSCERECSSRRRVAFLSVGQRWRTFSFFYGCGASSAKSSPRRSASAMADGGDAGAAASGGDGAAGGVGDTPKKEPKGRLSFLTKLNPFAKESEKEKEEKRAATEQKNKELAEAKKKRDDIEKEKGNREEAKESSRLAAKREKYQRLLQKNPDTTKRVFQFRMKAIKLEALTQERLSSYLRIMVGGDYTEREVPGI